MKIILVISIFFFINFLGITQAKRTSVIFPINSTVGYFATVEFKNEIMCAGAIINEKWVLTSAECVRENKDSGTIKVRLGTTIKGSGGTVVTVMKTFEHYAYDSSTHTYDIALLLLSKPVKFTHKIFPIELPNEDFYILDRDLGKVISWSFNEYEDNENLLESIIPLYNNRECISKHFLIDGRVLTSSSLCTGYEFGGNAWCYVTPGSPIILRNVLIGIAARGFCSETRLPTIFTRTHFADYWIKAVMECECEPDFSSCSGD